jgi:hypothetical protein
MNRRAFVTGLGALLVAPLAAEGQQARKVWRIAWLSSASPGGLNPEGGIFGQAFRDLGYVQGQNVAVEFRWTEGTSDQLSTLATEVVRRKVDAIVAVGPQAIRAAKQATAVIPSCIGRNCPCLCHVETLRLAHYNGHVVRRRGRIPGVSPRRKSKRSPRA